MIPAEKPAKLTVSISNGMSIEIRLGLRETRIGRGREADLQLPDPSVSRLHARIFRVGEQHFLSDSSKNGTFHNGKRITQLLLESGQTFGIVELSRQERNKTRTARELGIAKATQFEKLNKYEIRPQEPDRQ